MRQLKLLVSVGALLTATFAFAQQPLILALPDTFANTGDTLRVDITARQFTEIYSIQFSFRWNQQVLQYTGFEETNLRNVGIGASGAANGILRFSWADFEGNGKTLPDGSSVIRFKFFVRGNLNDSTALTITGSPLSIQVFRSDGTGRGQQVPLNPQNGSVTVGTPVAVRATFAISNVACRGDSTGAINTNFTTIPSGAIIRWTGPNNFQSEQEDLSRLRAGAYRLQVQSNQRIVFDSTLTVSQPAAALRIGTLAPVQASCLQPTGAATVTGTGGTAPYQYNIGDGFTTANQFTNLQPGLYTLTVRDANNCTVSDTFRIREVNRPSIDLTDTVFVCNNQPTMLDAGQHSTYRWSTGALTPTITVTAPGIYSVTVTNTTGCSATDSVRVIAGLAPPLTLQDTISICNGQSVTIDAGNYATYRWSNNATTRTISVTTAGTYSVTVTSTDGCTSTGSVRVRTGTNPVLQLQDTVVICGGQTTTLDAGNYTSYRWSTGASTRTIRITNPGTYRITVTNATGCSASDSTQVVTSTPPVLQLQDSVALCNGQNTTLDAGSFAAYRWSTGATTRTINVATGGVYSVTVSNTAGCTATDSVRVLISPVLNIALPDTVSICNGQNATLDAGVFASYQWSNGATTRTITINNLGIYRVTVTNATCTATDSVQVLASNTLFMPLPDTAILCIGQNRVLDAGAFTTYRWSTGATTRSITVTTAGVYKVTVTNSGGCTGADSVRVQAAPIPQIQLADTILICNGENELLDAGIFSSYRWSTGATTRSINVSITGNYSVTVTNADGCTAADTVRVQADSDFTVKIENDTLTVCQGNSLQLRASSADTYQWIDTSRTLNALNLRNPIAQPRTTTAYTLLATGTCGTDTVQAVVQVRPFAGTAGQDTTIRSGTVLELYASGGIAYFWQLSEYPVSNPSIPNPKTQPKDTTFYIVQIIDSSGCQKLDTIRVFVDDNPLNIVAVNLITPNGDGKNDVLEFEGLDKQPGTNILKVFNRWGDQVYQKINYQKDDERFDGTRNGKPLPAGNYYYVLSFKEGDVKQTLTILRE
jgi:gliding motility-associated-like protein